VSERVSLVVLLFVFLASCCTATATTEDPSYELSPWPYGAIAWVGGAPSDAQTRSETIAQALQDVFSFWGLPSPELMEGWENPAAVEPAWRTGATGPVPQVVKKDPPTDTLWRLNPLIWEGVETYPMLIIAFPTRELLAQAMGSTAWGGVWIPGNAAIPGSEVWYQGMTGVPQSISVPYQDAAIVTWHEIAHWLTYLVCLRERIYMGWLPDLVVEGIAEYTATSLVGVDGWKQYAASWAQQNELTVDLGVFDTYQIGLSVVAYLVEAKGVAAFWRELHQWIESPEAEIAAIETGWRDWLQDH